MRPRSLALASAAGFPLLLGLAAGAQTQSLAFTGGVLLNTSVTFRNLGFYRSPASPGVVAGSAVNRTYEDGFNRIDATGNADATTVNYGYLTDSQIEPDALRLSAGSAEAGTAINDAGAFLEPSGNLEYRGSLGPLGSSDWGMVLAVGYQYIGARVSEDLQTDAEILEDRFALGSTSASDLPPAPHVGSADADGPRIGSQPTRFRRGVPGGRRLEGTWEVSAEFIPIAAGLYFETQIAGRLNAVASAGVLMMLVDADLEFSETSTIQGLPAIREKGSEGTNDYIWGGFTQVALDWALWENASIVGGVRWQPTQTFDHSVSGRTVEIDFNSAFAVHAGFSMRF